MREVLERIKGIFSHLDPILFSCSTLLSLISILTVYGAVDNFGKRKLIMQVAMFVVGLLVTLLISTLDFKVIIDRFWKPLFIGSVALLIITPILGVSGLNMETANKSWLVIPFTGIMIQPSEFVKATLLCTFSMHLFAVQDHINKPLTVLFLGAHALLYVIPILLSGDLGVALIYLAIIALMLFCAGLHPLYFAGVLLVVLLLSPYLWDKLAPYQQQRIIVGFNPELDPLGKGMQPLLSKAAIAAGGFFGQGLFTGGYYEILPASHTDFIFATVCEKFGFLGGALIILIFMVMVIRIFMIARIAGKSDYGGLICAGVGAMLVVQVLENLGMCFAMLPVIGITLPFLSCGGSSMLATFLMFGLVHSVYSHSDTLRRYGGRGLRMDF